MGFSVLNTQRACLRGGIALGDLAPVHGVPPRLEIIGAAVLVVEIIGVLPDIVSEQRALAVHDRTVLGRAGLDLELAVPCGGHAYPARAEMTPPGRLEILPEFF